MVGHRRAHRALRSPLGEARHGWVPPSGAPAQAVTAARRGARARRDTDGDAGAGAVPRPPTGRGAPRVRGRAPFVRATLVWGVSRPPAHLPKAVAGGSKAALKNESRHLAVNRLVVLLSLLGTGAANPDFSPVVWKKAVPRGIICSGSTGYADRRGRPYEHRV
jgi:hypothetical protein